MRVNARYSCSEVGNDAILFPIAVSGWIRPSLTACLAGSCCLVIAGEAAATFLRFCKCTLSGFGTALVNVGAANRACRWT